jgi:predicted acylesterase/phospholipase RssA
VNLVTGESEYWNESSGEALVDGVLASSSFPMFFEPVAGDGALYTDDGIREITPVKQAIEAGATELDVICASPEHVVGAFDPSSNGLPLGQRILDAMSAEIDRWDLKAAELYNALVDAGAPGYEDRTRVTLRVLRPDGPVLENALDFDPAKVRDNIERGHADASALTW